MGDPSGSEKHIERISMVLKASLITTNPLSFPTQLENDDDPLCACQHPLVLNPHLQSQRRQEPQIVQYY